MYLDHLEELHDTVERPDGDPLHYWWIYAAPEPVVEAYPSTDTEYEPFPASHEGITCVDDVARIVDVYLSHYRLVGDDHSRRRARQGVEFVRYMQQTDGTFLNFVTDPSLNERIFGEADPDVVEGIRVDGTATSEASLRFWSSRACWALGEAYEVFVDEDPAFAEAISESIHSYLGALEDGPLADYGEYEQRRGRTLPTWLPGGGSYVAAPTVLGLSAYCRAARADDGTASDGGTQVQSGDQRAARALRQLADGIRDCRSGNAITYPFGAHVSEPPGKPWHTWGLRQAAALARAGAVLDEPDYVDSARREVTALHSLHLTNDGQIASFGPVPHPYHQLSYGTDALVQGCTELWRATGEDAFAYMGGQFATWYCGNNVAEATMWDPDAGRGYDGLYEDTIDWKAGAESTLAAVRTMLDVERFPEPTHPPDTVQVADSHSQAIADTETGTVDGAATRLNPGGSEAVFTGGRVVKVFEDGSVTVTPDFEPDEYRPYVVVSRTIAPDATAVVTIGDERQTVALGGAPESHYEVIALDTVEMRGDERVTVGYSGAQDRAAKVDALVFHPAVAWRSIHVDEEWTAAIARSVVEEERSVSLQVPPEVVEPGNGPLNPDDTPPADGSEPLSVRALDRDGFLAHREDRELAATDRDDAETVTVTVEPCGITIVRST
jgi:hypothetical protein